MDSFSNIVSEFKTKFESPLNQMKKMKESQKILISRDMKRHSGSIASLKISESDIFDAFTAYRYFTLNHLVPENYNPVYLTKDIMTLQELIIQGGGKPVSMLQAAAYLSQQIVTAVSASFDSFTILLDEKTSGTQDHIVRAIMIRKNLIPAIQKISEFIVLDSVIDLRWSATLLKLGYATLFRIKHVSHSFSNISYEYGKLKKEYPFDTGSEYYWDILFHYVLKDVFEKLKILGKDIIDGRVRKLESGRQASRSLVRTYRRPSSQTDVDMPTESILYDIFKRQGVLDSATLSKIEIALDRTFRQIANKKYGMQDLKDESKLIEIGLDIYTKMIWSFPILAYSVINPIEYGKLLNNPESYVRANKGAIIQATRKKLTNLLLGKVSTRSLARLIAKFIQKAYGAKRY